jgi:hypothetical protein
LCTQISGYSILKSVNFVKRKVTKLILCILSRFTVYSQGRISGEVPGAVVRGPHNSEIQSTDFTETTAFLKSRKIGLYF